MAKLTSQVLVSWLHTNKSVEDLLKTTRSTIESVEQFINEKLTGDVQEKWKKKISEYKTEHMDENESSKNVEFSDEEAYITAKKQFALLEGEISRAEEEQERLIQELKKNKEKCEKLREEKADLEDKIEDLEQKLAINLVYDESHIDKFDLKFYFNINDINKDNSINDDMVGELFGKYFRYLPGSMEIQSAILVMKSIIFIKNIKESGRILKIYAPTEIIQFIESCNTLDGVDIEKFATD